MKVAIPIDGKPFVPVAAVPYITKGKVTERLLVNTLISASYGSDDDATPDFPAYRLLPLGNGYIAARVSRDELVAIADAIYLAGRAPLDKVASLLISEEVLRAQMRTSASRTIEGSVGPDTEPVLDLEPEVPWDVAVQLWAQLPLGPDFSVGRKNGRDALADRIDAAMNRALESLAEAGIVVERGSLPGRKADWQRVLQSIDAKIAMAPATLASYFKDLGIKFRPGAKSKDAHAVLQHFGLPSV